MAGKFEIFKHAASAERFRLKARDGEIILASARCKSNASARVASVMATAPGAEIVDLAALVLRAGREKTGATRAHGRAAPEVRAFFRKAGAGGLIRAPTASS